MIKKLGINLKKENNMLTTTDMIKIMTEETLGKPPTIKGEEADEFRRNVKKDIDKIKAEGGIVEIPNEW